MPDGSSLEDLATYLGADAASSLYYSSRVNGYLVRVPATPWKSTDGYSGAMLNRLIVGSEQLIVKYLPPPAALHRSEPAQHKAAHDTDPKFARHLARQPHNALVTSSFGILMFQKLAGDGAPVLPLGGLPGGPRVEVAQRIVGDIVRYWNAGRISTKKMRVSEFLRSEAGDALQPTGTVEGWAKAARLVDISRRWIEVSGRVLPNPVILALGNLWPGSPEIDVLCGIAHRDLHTLNVLVPLAEDGTPEIDNYYLIDLATSREPFSLTHDPVFLMLSSIAGRLGGLPTADWHRLLEEILEPIPAGVAASKDGPRGIVRAIRRAFRDAVADAQGGWTEWSRRQFLLSTQVLALVFTRFEDLEPLARWRFFELSARAAYPIVKELLSEWREPASAVEVRNPFIATISQRRAVTPAVPDCKPVKALWHKAIAADESGDAKGALRILGEAYELAVETLGTKDDLTMAIEERFRSPQLRRRRDEQE